MLNIFRERQTLVKVVMGIVLFLVVITMVITLIPGLTGDPGDTANPVVADVAGDRITEFDVQQDVQQISSQNKIPAEMMPYYTAQILNELIEDKASLKEAERLGLKVDQGELQAQLRRDPNLFPNGQFVGEQQYEDMVSERYGTTVAQYEQRLRQAMLLAKLRELVTDSITVTPEEVHNSFVKENEKLTLDYVAVNPGDFKKEVTPSEDALQAYFKTNKDRYQEPEKRRAKILLFTAADFRKLVTPTEDQLKSYYQAHLDKYHVPETVTVAHILFKADPKNPAQMEQARKKAEEVLKKVKAGAEFLGLAKQYSEDTTTAPSGGVLVITRKQTVPEFGNVAFSLGVNQVSGLVQTMYGIHIIKVLNHEQARLRSFDEMKASIRSTVTDEMALKELSDSADAASRALEKSPADVQAIAEKYHGEVIEPAPFTQSETIPQVAASAGFMPEVFGLEKNHPGQPVQVGNDAYAIPVLLDIFPAHPADYAEVKEQVKNDYIDEQARGKAMAKAQELGKLLDAQPKDKKDLKAAAKTMGLTVKTSPPVTRDGTIPSLGNVKELDPRTFSMPIGWTAGPLPLAGQQVVYQVVSREPPNEQEFAAKKAQIEQKLLDDKRQLAFQVFQESLKRRLTASGDLKLNQDAVAHLTSTTK